MRNCRRLSRWLVLIVFVTFVTVLVAGCGNNGSAPPTAAPTEETSPNNEAGTGTITVTDMMGRTVEVPKGVNRVVALKHLGTMVFALGQQDKLVHQGLLNATAKAMAEIDPEFAALPYFKSASVEEIMALGTELVFAYQSTDPKEIEQLTSVGIPVIVLKGETLEDSYEALRIMGQALECPGKAEEYIQACQGIVDMVQERIKDVPEEDYPKVFFAGPKNIFTAAGGDMLQNTMIKLAGGINVAEETIGNWAQISPEQLMEWNPEVIFLGSTTGEYEEGDVFSNQALQSITAVKNKRVYPFPSNIGWWDFPAPHCVLGIQWMATKLYPDKFKDVDMTEVADDFYQRFVGKSFTELGGKL